MIESEFVSGNLAVENLAEKAILDSSQIFSLSLKKGENMTRDSLVDDIN